MRKVIPHNTQHKLLPQPVCYALFETDNPLAAVDVERVFPDWSTDALWDVDLVKAFPQVRIERIGWKSGRSVGEQMCGGVGGCGRTWWKSK